MFFSQFPAEIIAHLTEQLIIVDLVLLHACGDSILNEKLRIAPITIKLLTTRCMSYHKKQIADRFENVANLVHFATGYDHRIQSIPKTVRRVVTNVHLTCTIPASVRELSTHYISKLAHFESKPGELKVSVKDGGGGHLEYITHLEDYAQYNKKMISLESISIPTGSDCGPIPGVSFEYVPVKCHHSSVKKRDTLAANGWFSYGCQRCGHITSIVLGNGSNYAPIPSCDTLDVEQCNFDFIEEILESISGDAGTLLIKAPVDEMNKFVNSGGLDRVPPLVRKVYMTIIVRENPHFIGVPKIYPFLIRIDSMSGRECHLEIADFKGIDECTWTTLVYIRMREDVLKKYPRLSIV